MTLKGPWPPARVAAYLNSTVVPLRLSAVSDSGWPVVVSLWFLFRDGALWCASSPKSRIVGLLRENDRCGFEVAADAPPYRGVRGQGRATLDRDRDLALLRTLTARYLGPEETAFTRWLLGRSEDEVAIRIAPLRMMSWDYTERMGAD